MYLRSLQTSQRICCKRSFFFFGFGTRQPWFPQQFHVFHCKRIFLCPLYIYLLLFPIPQFFPEHRPWLPKLARESRPQAPPSRISRVPLAPRVSLVPNISVLPLVSVLRKSKVLKPAYLSPREKRKFSVSSMNWHLPVLILVSADGRNMYVVHRYSLYPIAKDIKSLPKDSLQRNNLRWVALASECP